MKRKRERERERERESTMQSLNILACNWSIPPPSLAMYVSCNTMKKFVCLFFLRERERERGRERDWIVIKPPQVLIIFFTHLNSTLQTG